MELVLTVEELEPEPKVFKRYNKSLGLLNSNYKKIVKETLRETTSHSLFGKRQHVKRCQYKFTSSIDTILKVSTFLFIFIVIFS